VALWKELAEELRITKAIQMECFVCHWKLQDCCLYFNDDLKHSGTPLLPSDILHGADPTATTGSARKCSSCGQSEAKD